MTTTQHAAPLPRVSLTLPPAARLIAAATVFAAVALAAIWFTTARPWLGLQFHVGDDGLVVLTQVQRADLDGAGSPGLRVERIGDLALRAEDLIEEPDTLPSYEALNDFRARQAELMRLLQQPRIDIVGTREDGTTAALVLEPQAGRPLWSLPFEFWLQLFVGGAGIVVGGFVWALKPDRSSRFLALSGLGLALSAISAAIYSTRELALPAAELIALTAGNYVGTTVFGLALVSLLLVYPHRLCGPWVIAAVWAAGLVLGAAHLFQLMPSQTLGSYGPMLLQFIAIFALLLVQLVRSRRSPVARAALGWFGLSILLGTGVFIFAIAVPVMLGLEPQTSQAHAFGIILLIYCGLAIGVARYRLFDLGLWSFRLVSYLLGGFILIGLDALLIYVVALERLPAFGLALLAVALLYLPLRNAFGSLLARPSRIEPSRVREVFDIALAGDAAEQERQWRELLESCFAPLQIEPAAPAARAELVESGEELLVPATAATPPLVMRHARGGRRLFSRADAGRLQELVELMGHALASRDAHERGARQERARLARDLHDNIGAQLLRTLHSPDTARKDAIVAETLTDLRDIINNAQGTGMKLAEILAELRFETDERLTQAGLAMHWETEIDETGLVDARLAHTLRSIIREAASNTIRHAGASRLAVRLRQTAGEMQLDITDDGRGVSAADLREDGGLANLAARVDGHDGAWEILGRDGTQIAVRLPLMGTGR